MAWSLLKVSAESLSRTRNRLECDGDHGEPYRYKVRVNGSAGEQLDGFVVGRPHREANWHHRV